MDTLNIDSTFWERRFKRFEKILKDVEIDSKRHTCLLNCYKNKKLLGVTYHDKIENEIKIFDKLVEKYEGHSEWVKYLD